jgi:hypothetical protein
MTVENKTGQSVAEKAWGKKLDAPISYEYSYTTYESGEELVAAKDELTIDEQLKVRNSERQTNARQKALAVALDAAGIVKPTAENDSQIALRDMVKTLLTSKMPDGSRRYTEEKAREVASLNLGVEWAE